MASAPLIRSACNTLARLVEILRDSARHDRAIVLLLTGYALAWTLYGSIAKSSQDLHPDMVELIAWSRDLSLGYPKHPPLGAWLVRLWFSVFPLEDWSFYLLAMLMPTLALWIFWRLSADYLDIEKCLFGLALLMVMPFYNFHALKYNPNTLLMPVWAATTLAFLRSCRSRSASYAALAGLGAGISMLAKYWSVFLLAGLIVAALIDPRRRTYFLSAAPWVTVAVGFAVLGPHLIWIYQHDFMSIQYAIARHAAHSIAHGFGQVFLYFGDTVGYAAAPVLLVFLLLRPSRAAIAEMIWPSDRELRLVAAAFWGPLLLPIVGTLAVGTAPTALWSMPGWTLLPVLMLSPQAIKIEAGKLWSGKLQADRLQVLLGAVIAEPLVMLIAAPAIALAIHRIGVEPAAAHGRLLAADTEQAWRQATPQPLRFVGCDMADEVITYAKDRPHALPWRFFNGDVADMVYAEGRNWPQNPKDPQVSEADLAASGMALVCSTDRSDWVEAAAARAARDPSSRRIEVESRRDFLGFPGRPARYVIFIIPPRS
jgi:4-amino-4-deoxy-L-arabinose transferase-like glycosyltransferase